MLQDRDLFKKQSTQAAPVERNLFKDQPATKTQDLFPKLAPYTPDPIKENAAIRALKNFGPDSIGLVKKIFADIPVALVSKLTDLGRDPINESYKLAQFLANKDDQLDHALLDPYRKMWKDGIIETFAEHPAETLADIAGLASIGGGLVGKIGTQVGSKALVKTGAVLAKAGTNIDPVGNMFKVAKVATKPLHAALGFGTHASEITKLKARAYSTEELAKRRSFEDVRALGISPDDYERVNQAIESGKLAEYQLLAPNQQKFYDQLKRYAREEREPWLDEEGILPRAAQKAGDIRRAAILEWRAANPQAAALGRGPTKKKLKPYERKVAQEIKAGIRDPFYHALYAELADDDLAKLMNPNLRRTTRPSAMKRLMGRAKEYIQDPIETYIRSRDAYHASRAGVNFLNSLEQYLMSKGAIKALAKGMEIPKGWSALPYELLKVSKQVELRTQAIAREAIKRGMSPLVAKRAAMKAISKDSAVVRGIKKAQVVIVPDHVAVYLKRMYGSVNPWMRVLDKARDVWKAAATIWNPAYWFNIPVANTIMGIYYGISPSHMRYVHKLKGSLPAESLAGFAQEFMAKPSDRWLGRLHESMIQRAGRLDDFLRHGVMVKEAVEEIRPKLQKELGVITVSEQTLLPALEEIFKSPQRLASLENKINQIERALVKSDIELVRLDRAKKRTLAQGLKDQSDRLAAEFDRKKAAKVELEARKLASQGLLPELQQLSAVADRAIVAANQIVGSFWRMHPLENSIMRRLVPFYTYTKMISNLAFRLPYLYPKRTFMWHQFARMIQDAVWDQDTPERIKAYVPIAIDRDGKILGAHIGSANPFNGVRMGTFAGVSIPSIMDVVAQHPLVTIFYEQSGGIPRWSMKPVTPGTNEIMISTGERYIVNHNGMLQKTLGGPPLLRSLTHMFPQTQLIEHVVQPYIQTDRGWLLDPDPVMEPGTDKPAFPLELWQQLMRLVPFTPKFETLDPEREKQMKQLKKDQIRRRIMKVIRYAPLEKQQEYTQILEHWNSIDWE